MERYEVEGRLFVNDDFEITARPDDKGNSLQNKIIAISRSLARSQINWTLEQRKLFAMCLSKIAWKQTTNSCEIVLEKNEIIKTLGLKVDSNHQSQYLRTAFRKLKDNSRISWTDPEDKAIWEDGDLIRRVRSTKGQIIVLFDDYYMPNLEGLAQNYVTFLTDDIYGFKSTFSYILFHELRLHCDTRKTNWREYTTDQLKALFGLKSTDYVRKDGTFDRYSFEKKVLDVAIEEINKTEMIKILPFKESEASPKKPNKCYEKLKKYGYVRAYRFKFWVKTSTTPPYIGLFEDGNGDDQG